MRGTRPDVVISARGIVNRFGRQAVHDGVSLDVMRGEILGIAGGSGSGKSVLLKTLVGLHRPDAGTVLLNGAPIVPAAQRRIIEAGLGGGILVSPVSAWEIGLLARARNGRPALIFLPDPKTWITRALSRPGIRLTPLTAEIAVDASVLPEPLHGDPADRMLIATARHLGVPVVTRDSRIIAYAEAGQVGVVTC